MQVCSVIVTYGDRVKLLSRVVQQLMKLGIRRLVLIINGSPELACAQIDAIALQYSPSVIVEKFTSNEGSAKGFKRGLEIAAQTDCDFIWILDDDNLPDDNALTVLKDFWKDVQNNRPENNIAALASLRKDRAVFLRVLDERNPNVLLWPVNSYSGFHIREILLKVKERIKPSGINRKEEVWQPIKLNVSFYGGLFFPRQVLTRVGLPDERIILYGDDLLFTNTISKELGEIWLVPQSIVHDIDVPFYIKEKKSFLYHSSLDGKNDTLVYYALRNSVFYISRHLVTNRLSYYLNKLFFLSFITFAGILRGKFRRLKLIYTAISHGENGKLGKSDIYKL